jgi:biotin transport system substrate-specific component
MKQQANDNLYQQPQNYPKSANLKSLDVTICGLFSALIAVGAFIKITIPVEPYAMHFTMQWFFVLMAGLLLGHKRAFTSVCVYLAIGLLGVPVFASGGGLSYILRPTFGFLLGFALAAFVMGWLMECSKKTSLPRMLVVSFVGLWAYYGVGMLYFYLMSNLILSSPVTWKIVLVNCCLLTVFEDALLCVLAVFVCYRLRPVLARL